MRRGARQLGLEERLDRLYDRWLWFRADADARRSHYEHLRIRLLAAGVLRKNSNCVDVGANTGQLLEFFTEIAPDGHHIAYEPVPDLADALSRRFPRAEVRCAAVADERGSAEFFVHTAAPTRSSLRRVGYSDRELKRIRVTVEDLDSSLPPDYVPDLVKVDVEGAEHLVLRGARQTLHAHRPLLLFEHQRSTAADYGSGPDEIFDLLADALGYRLFDMDGRGPYSRSSFRDTYLSGTRWNFLATPG